MAIGESWPQFSLANQWLRFGYFSVSCFIWSLPNVASASGRKASRWRKMQTSRESRIRLDLGENVSKISSYLISWCRNARLRNRGPDIYCQQHKNSWYRSHVDTIVDFAHIKYSIYCSLAAISVFGVCGTERRSLGSGCEFTHSPAISVFGIYSIRKCHGSVAKYICAVNKKGSRAERTYIAFLFKCS